MDQPKKLALPALALGLSIASGPMLAGFFVYKGMMAARASERFVTVKGLVERVVKSDVAEWDLRFNLAGNDLGELNTQSATHMEKVAAFLKEQGFAADEILVLPSRVTDTHARDYLDKLPPNRYLIQAGYQVKSKKVDLVEKVNTKLAQLIKEGVTLMDSNPRYTMSNFNEMRPEILAEATKSARAMAEQFAKDSGSKVGAIRRANQGVITIQDPNAGPSESWDSGQTTLMKKIRVVSTFDFFLES